MTLWFPVSLPLHSNGEVAEGLNHQMVVNLIRRAGDTLTLLVVSVTAEEAEHLESEAQARHNARPDLFDKRAIPLTIPDYCERTSEKGDPYVVCPIVYLAAVSFVYYYWPFALWR